MDKFKISGGVPLRGKIKASGAKNVAMKALVAALLTDEKVVIQDVPNISAVYGTAKIIESLGAKVSFKPNHEVEIAASSLKNFRVPLEMGGLYRTATMVIGPLLARFGKAVVPNPGGCRLGNRSIEMHIQALKSLGAKIQYDDEGFYQAKSPKGLKGSTFRFDKNTHTGTESLILSAVLAKGETQILNAAAEPEIDDLIRLLNQMGADVQRKDQRTIVIDGVKKLHGTTFKIMPDRNEVVTFAVAAIATHGDLIVENAKKEDIEAFLKNLDAINGGWEIFDKEMRFFYKSDLRACDVTTLPHPGFMTDWQGPWAVLATQADGVSVIHETIYSHRFSYVTELLKLGAKISFFEPKVENPQEFYNFNSLDRDGRDFQAIRIEGPSKLHNGILLIDDLRAGATLILAALTAKGESVIQGVEHLDRGYERIEERLTKIGAKIKRVRD